MRAGQPLAAVLGHQFERDLLAAGQPQYLAAFRKLSRFHTGSALEALEEVLRQSQEQLAQDLEQLARLEAAIPPLRATLDRANAALNAATAELARAQAAWQPYAGIAAELAAKQAALQNSTQTLSNLLAHRPAPPRTPHFISKPVIRQNGGPATVEQEPDYDEYTWGTDAGDTGWATSVAQARAAIASTQAIITQDTRIEASTAYTAAHAALAAAGNAVASAQSGQSDAQDKHDAAVAAAAAYEANTVQPQAAARRGHPRGLRCTRRPAGQRPYVDRSDLHGRRTRAARPLSGRTRGRHRCSITPRSRSAPPPARRRSIRSSTSQPSATPTTPRCERCSTSSTRTSTTVADLITAEAVHQLVQGNPVRSGAALDVAASGSVPDELEVIRTPRPAYDTTHRVLVLIDPALTPAWGLTADVGAHADPVLAAWLSRHLPNPATVTSPCGSSTRRAPGSPQR